MPGKCVGCTEHFGRRRTLLKIAASLSTFGLWGGATGNALAAAVNDTLPKAGDRLAAADSAKGEIVALKPRDIPKKQDPLLAYPFDPKTKKIRDQDRYSGVLLLSFETNQLDEKMQKLAGDGVLGYSAICTHKSCEIETYMPDKEVYFCFCHLSEFYPLKGGEVASGPAPSPLPNLPLSVNGGDLVVAEAFSAPIGPQ